MADRAKSLVWCWWPRFLHVGLGESCGNSVKVISHHARRCQRPGGGWWWKMPTVLYCALNMVEFLFRCCWWWWGGWGSVCRWGGKGESNDYRTWLGCRLWAVMRVVLGFWLFNKSQCDINLIFFLATSLSELFFLPPNALGCSGSAALSLRELYGVHESSNVATTQCWGQLLTSGSSNREVC